MERSVELYALLLVCIWIVHAQCRGASQNAAPPALRGEADKNFDEFDAYDIPDGGMMEEEFAGGAPVLPPMWRPQAMRRDAAPAEAECDNEGDAHALPLPDPEVKASPAEPVAEPELPSRRIVPLPAAPAPVVVDSRTINGSGNYVREVPSFTLSDPHGKALHIEDLYRENGMLIMLTVPTLSQYENQKRWNKYLRDAEWPALNKPACVVLEDLSQQSWFKDRARKAMAEKYDPNGEVKVLVDESGDVRRAFWSPENETVLLLVDRTGRVVHHVGKRVVPDPEAARNLLREVHALAAAHAAASTLAEQSVSLALTAAK